MPMFSSNSKLILFMGKRPRDLNLLFYENNTYDLAKVFCFVFGVPEFLKRDLFNLNQIESLNECITPHSHSTSFPASLLTAPWSEMKINLVSSVSLAQGGVKKRDTGNEVDFHSSVIMRFRPK